MPIPVQTKMHYKNVQILAVAYDIGGLICTIFRNLNDSESTNHCKRMHFQKSELMFCVTLKGKGESTKYNVN